MKLQLKSRKRRGLSSIVGALFFIVLLIAAFTALLAAFSYQNDLIDSQTKTSELEVAKAREKFYVTADIDGVTDTLFVTIKNQGTSPVEIANLWVIEKEDDYEAKQYDLNSIPPLNFEDVVIPVGITKDITSDVIPLDPAIDYTVKVVSRLGTVVTVDVPDTTIPPGPAGPQGTSCWDLDEDFVEDLIFGPSPPGPPDEDTNNDEVVDVDDCIGGQPGLSCWDLDGDTIPDPEEDVYPPPTGDGIWDALDCKGASGAAGEEIVLDPRFLQKPEIFLVFPSSHGIVASGAGSDLYQGLWGVTIANPTDVDMYVSKIVITAMSPRANSQDNIIPTPCTFTAVTTPTSAWGCYSQNQITWKNNTSLGTLVDPRSSKLFYITVKPGQLGSAPMEAIPITASVFTSMGQFGKTGYAASMLPVTAPIVNVYVTDTLVESQAVLSSHIDIVPRDLLKTDTLTLKVAIAEFNAEYHASNNRNYVNAGSRLIINVPKAFDSAFIAITSSAGFSTVDVIPYPDGSAQIIGTLSSNLGDSASKEAKIIEFTVPVDPTVIPDIIQPKLYVFPILANGDATYGSAASPVLFEVGPMQEYVVRVHP